MDISFLLPEELISAMYEYQLSEITENNSDIVQMAIGAAIEEMMSYLTPNKQARWRDGRPRYDVTAIFSSFGAGRNPLVLELCKSMAVYYVCRLSNVDIIQERVKERYDRAIDWLEKVSGTGKYADAPAISANLPVLPATDPESDSGKPYRSGSRTKFNHE
jgi:phage gp36-like protein